GSFNFAVGSATVNTPTPSSGVIGASLTVTGSSFSASSAISYSVDGGSFASLSGCNSGAGGAVSCSFTIPSGLAQGSHTLALQDASSNSGSTTFTVNAAFTSITPNNGIIGASLTLAGNGFAA